MIKVLFFLLAMISLRAEAQKIMQMTDQTTDVSFVSKHLLGRLEGTFKGVNGSAAIDSGNLAGSFLKLSFVTASVLQNDYLAGPNLLKTGCLNNPEFPEVQLSSTAITKLPGSSQYQFDGTLTVKGLVKSISFPFIAKPNFGGYDFTFTFPIVKKLYNMHCAVRKKFQISVRGYGKMI